MSFGRRHTTGLTLITTAAVAILLSLSPLPDTFRPFPKLRDGNADDLVAGIFPNRAARPATPLPVTAEDAPAVAVAAKEGPEFSPARFEPPPVERPRELALRLLGAAEWPKARELERLGTTVGARHVAIEQGCRRVTEAGFCSAPALAPLFRELDALLAGARKRPVRVIHVGDSLIASDHITDLIRSRMQARYGSGGRGFLFVDRPTPGSGRTVRTGRASPGWEIAKITDRGGPKRPVGFSGVTFAAAATPAEVEYDLQGSRVAELFFLTDPRGGDLQVRADGQPVGRIFTRFANVEAARARTRVPPGARKLTVSTRGPVSLYGVALEGGGAGVVYDSVGLPGATAKLILRSEESLFSGQLSQRDPSLVVLMLGGNEAFEFSRKETSPEEARSSFRALVKRVRQATPDAACLLTAPLDAGVRRMSGEIVPRPGSAEMAQVIREVALESGCAYWDMLSAMGGLGAVPRWLKAGLMHEDLVHPRARGADLIGHLFDLALTEAHLAWKGGAALQDPPGLESADSLRTVFADLRALETTRSGRVGMVQLGASHTASQMFTDALRTELAQRFGLAGRGYIAAGKSSPRLTNSGVRRTLSGSWSVLDAIKPVGSKAWSLTGTRAEGREGARIDFTFCEACEGGARSRLQLHYLESPGMAKLEVLLDGERRATLPEGKPSKTPVARVVALEADGEKHVLSVIARGQGTAQLFGAAHELDRAGVVLDAVGLPGSTIFTLAQYDRDALMAQLVARRPSLYLLFYGTNESAMSDVDLDKMRRSYGAVFSTLKAASPDSSCLLIGPTDRMELEKGAWVEAPSQRRVIPALRDVARAHGCAFWSARAAMGGPGAIARWLERSPSLAHPDHVHLTPAGYETLARALADDLISAYDTSRGGP